MEEKNFIRADLIKKNNYIIHETIPYKVIRVDKPTKFSHNTQLRIQEIFSENKSINIRLSNMTSVEIPKVTKIKYDLIDISDGGVLSLETSDMDVIKTKNTDFITQNILLELLKEGKNIKITLLEYSNHNKILKYESY